MHTHFSPQVPDATGRSTLVVDLGRFSLSSAPTTLPKQTPPTPAPAAQPQAAARTGGGGDDASSQGCGSGLMSLCVWTDPQRPLSAVAPNAHNLSAEEAAVYEVRARVFMLHVCAHVRVCVCVCVYVLHFSVRLYLYSQVN